MPITNGDFFQTFGLIMGFLKDYNFALSYHPGKANVVADALSRKSFR